MPLYEYRCTACGHVFEKIQSFSAPDEKECPKCKGQVERLLSAPAIQFKGSGFYLTDYGKSGGASKGSGKSEGSGDKSSSTANSGSTPAAGSGGSASSSGSSSAASSTPSSGSSSGGSSGSGSSSGAGSGGSGKN